ncbi:hypothetical protein CBI38_30035 [Rhodococcus oxybenzonivorans]|uniref:Uncharacterized protein n=1 Tax=Rhodococcus oxybenzonivorans TaxID=1990687 RepID=A0A2S2C2Q8_9NOCA|nr:hypothetical protein [Rhodococcus oxybenzonivorans]AWK75165.1 hypothetical protein CBI38_30035 [Rhodococcus oxybenzonivorans]
MRDRQVPVGMLHERLPVEPGEVRVQHLHLEALIVHELHALVDVVGRRMGFVEAGGAAPVVQLGVEVLPVPVRPRPRALERLITEEPQVRLGLLIELDVQHVRAPRLRQAFGPQIRRLDEMGISVDNPVLTHGTTILC